MGSIDNRFGKTLFLLAIIAVTLCCSGFNYAPVYKAKYRNNTVTGSYRVKRGDTLYSIAWSFGQDYRVLAKRNHIPPPYAIHPGQIIRLQGPPHRAAKTHSITHGQTTDHTKKSRWYKRWQKTKSQHRPRPKHKPKPESRSKPVAKRPIIKHTKADSRYLHWVRHWRWPTNGKVIAGYQPYKGNKGINISNHRGTAVRATASGQVVYSGIGLAGYGKLIIVKHNSLFLSAYAHNDHVYVKEGQYVRAGQKIASMGNTGAKRVMLHFEIRRAGKPVNPLRLLPRRHT